MWNTNTELETRIKSLEKEFERFSQNVEPKSGYYDGQLWYDKVNWQMKVWNGTDYVSMWWWSGVGWGKTLIFSRASSVWTGNQSFTWFWFTPSSYRILASREWISATDAPCFSDWWYDGTTQAIMQVADHSNVVLTWYVLRLLYDNQGWSRTSATHVSFDSDWITLNFNFSWENSYLFITCYP